MKTNAYVLIFFFFATFYSVAQVDDSQDFDILYSEYHAANSYASDNENEESLADFVLNFEKLNNVVIKEVFRVPLTDYSGAYFFTLSELDVFEKTKFISSRLIQMDSIQAQRAISMLLTKPKKLSVYVEAISDDGKKCANWKPSDLVKNFD